MAGASHLATAFGLGWRSDIALPRFDAIPLAEGDRLSRPVVEVRAISTLALRAGGRSVNRGHVYADGIRLGWREEALFDMFEGRRIDFLPGPRWTGMMPAVFFGTLASLTLAWHGAIPLHASTVEIGGKALLIAGPRGAGKSTTAAALLAHGARLVSDDLTIVDPWAPDGVPLVRRGRPEMRLYPDAARQLDAAAPNGAAADARGKLLVRPLARCESEAVPLAAILLLGAERAVIDPIAAAALMPELLFRPRWLNAMPGHRERIASLMSLPGRMSVGRLPVVERAVASNLAACAGQALALFDRLAGS